MSIINLIYLHNIYQIVPGKVKSFQHFQIKPKAVEDFAMI
jgi:hypothetical protein